MKHAERCDIAKNALAMSESGDVPALDTDRLAEIARAYNDDKIMDRISSQFFRAVQAPGAGHTDIFLGGDRPMWKVTCGVSGRVQEIPAPLPKNARCRFCNAPIVPATTVFGSPDDAKTMYEDGGVLTKVEKPVSGGSRPITVPVQGLAAPVVIEGEFREVKE